MVDISLLTTSLTAAKDLTGILKEKFFAALAAAQLLELGQFPNMLSLIYQQVDLFTLGCAKLHLIETSVEAILLLKQGQVGALLH